MKHRSSAFLIILCTISFLCGIALANDTVKVKHEPGKGFKVESTDGDFDLTIGGLIQLRHTYESFDNDRGLDDDTVSDFTAERIRIWLKGKVFKEWNYKFMADFGKGASKLNDGLIEWAPSDQANLSFGQFKVTFDRQQKISAAKRTFADVSLAASAFGIVRDIGLMFHGALADKKYQYNIGAFNGEGDGQHNPNNGHLLVGRFSYNPNGDFGLSESDIKNTDKHLWFVDAAAALNTKRIYEDWNGDGQDDKADVMRYVAGIGYRHAGLYTQAEYYHQEENPDIIGLRDVKAHGWYAQAGYMLKPETWEVAARYSMVDPDCDVDDNNETEVMIGVNRFLLKAGHAFKVTWDIARLTEEDGSGVEYKDIRSRLQLQIVF